MTRATKVAQHARWIASVQQAAPLRHEFLGTEIRLAFQAMDTAFASKVAMRLAPAHGTLLLLIEEHPDLSQQQLSAAIGLQRSTMTRAIDGLERRGLVRRHARKGDQRSNAIRTTPRGASLASHLRTVIFKLEDQLRKRLRSRGHRLLITLLRDVQRELSRP